MRPSVIITRHRATFLSLSLSFSPWPPSRRREYRRSRNNTVDSNTRAKYRANFPFAPAPATPFFLARENSPILLAATRKRKTEGCNHVLGFVEVGPEGRGGESAFGATLIGRALILMYAVPPRGFSGPVKSRKGAGVEGRKEKRGGEETRAWRERERERKADGRRQPSFLRSRHIVVARSQQPIVYRELSPFPFCGHTHTHTYTHIYI